MLGIQPVARYFLPLNDQTDNTTQWLWAGFQPVLLEIVFKMFTCSIQTVLILASILNHIKWGGAEIIILQDFARGVIRTNIYII